MSQRTGVLQQETIRWIEARPQKGPNGLLRNVLGRLIPLMRLQRRIPRIERAHNQKMIALISVSFLVSLVLRCFPSSDKIFFSELATPITRRQLDTVAEFASLDNRLQFDEFRSEESFAALQAKRMSVLDILVSYETDLPLATYIEMLQPLAARQYSISSSPIDHADTEDQGLIASLTYDVYEAPALSGLGAFKGVASTYLAERNAGDHIYCSVRATNVGFRMPNDLKTPLILVAAGTGIAPMRAFLQERAVIARAGQRTLGPAILYYGCRNEKDLLYADELKTWEEQGLVKVKTAFSKPTGDGPKRYAQDVIWEDRHEAVELFRNGGKVFLCGSAARLGASTSSMIKKIYIEGNSVTEEQAERWLEEVKTDRYVSDVY